MAFLLLMLLVGAASCPGGTSPPHPYPHDPPVDGDDDGIATETDTTTETDTDTDTDPGPALLDSGLYRLTVTGISSFECPSQRPRDLLGAEVTLSLAVHAPEATVHIGDAILDGEIGEGVLAVEGILPGERATSDAPARGPRPRPAPEGFLTLAVEIVSPSQAAGFLVVESEDCAYAADVDLEAIDRADSPPA